MSADEAKINDPDDNEIDITSLYCDTCSKACYIWSILQNRNIFIGIWDFSQEFKILTFCSGECQKEGPPSFKLWKNSTPTEET